jgi:DNA-binding response OmpR family regulator
MTSPNSIAVRNGTGPNAAAAEVAGAYAIFGEYLTANLANLQTEAAVLGVPWPQVLRRRLSTNGPPQSPATSAAECHTIEVGELRIDLDAYTCVFRGRLLDLSHKEFELLVFLARNAGNVMTYRTIADNLWDGHPDASKTIQVHVKRIRIKLRVNPNEPPITTVRCVGYRYEKA